MEREGEKQDKESKKKTKLIHIRAAEDVKKRRRIRDWIGEKGDGEVNKPKKQDRMQKKNMEI